MPKDERKVIKVPSSYIKHGFSLIVILIIGAVLIAFQGENPIVALCELVKGIFGSWRALGNAIRWITPCIFTGAAAMVAFRSGVFNLGIEGQLCGGALTAALVGYYFSLPSSLHPVICLIVGGITGMLIALIPAAAKYYFGVNELVTTLMLNYIIVLIAEYLVVIVKKISTTNFSKAMTTPPILESAKLKTIVAKTNANTGVFLALFVIISLFLIYRFFIVGYEMKQVGDNLRYSLIGGVKVTKIYFITFLLSGLIAGLAGSVEAVGVYGKYMPNASINLGWDGIMITLVAKNKPVSVVIVAILWGALKSGSLAMELTTNTNRLTVELMQALFVLFVTVDYSKIIYSIRKQFKKYKRGSEYANEDII